MSESQSSRRLSDHVASQVQRWISEQQLQSGAQLPTERELCEKFGVSRPVIREAISRLKADGFVLTRQGSGAYVAGRPGHGSFRLVGETVETPTGPMVEMAHIFELRFLVETGAAERAAQRRSEADLERLRAVLARMQTALDEEKDAVGDDDAFHIAIGAATHNPQIERFLVFMGQQFSDSREPTWNREGHRSGQAREAQAGHVRIFDAIAAGDPAAARAAAAAHLMGAARHVGIDPRRLEADQTEEE